MPQPSSQLGLGLDDWATDVAESASDDIDVFEVHEGIALRCGEDVHVHSEDEEHSEEEEGHSDEEAHSDEEDSHSHNEDEHGHSDEEGHDDEHSDEAHSDEKDEDHHDEDEHGHDEDEEHAHSDEESHSDEEAGHSEDEAHSDEEKNSHSDEEDHDDHGHSEDGCDPHVWLSPSNMEVIADNIAEELASIYPDRADEFEENAETFKEDVRVARAEAEALLADKTSSEIVTFHDAFEYFARDFGLEVVGTIEPFAGQEPTPQYLAEVSDTVEEIGVSAIFREPQLADSVVSSLADDLGLEVKTLNPLGGTDDITSYEDLIIKNAEVIASSLR